MLAVGLIEAHTGEHRVQLHTETRKVVVSAMPAPHRIYEVPSSTSGRVRASAPN